MLWVLIRIASASLSLNYPQIPSLSGLLVQTIFVQFVFCTKLFTEKHVHFTTLDEVMTLILFKFLYCSFYDKKKKKEKKKGYSKCSKNFNTLFLFLQNVYK